MACAGTAHVCRGGVRLSAPVVLWWHVLVRVHAGACLCRCPCEVLGVRGLRWGLRFLVDLCHWQLVLACLPECALAHVHPTYVPSMRWFEAATPCWCSIQGSDSRPGTCCCIHLLLLQLLSAHHTVQG